MMREAAIVAAGGAVGAASRYLIGVALTGRAGTGFPWATFAINIGGAFLIGVLMALSLERGAVSANWRLLLGTGVLGGFTTFSTLAYESLALLQRGLVWQGLGNMFGSGVAGLVAAWLGIVAGRAI